jgi:hypothetical protein
LSLRLQLGGCLSRRFLALGLLSRGFDPSGLLTGSLLSLRLQLGGCLSRRFLALGLLSRGFDPSGLLTSSLLHRSRLLNGSLLRLRIASLLQRITGIVRRGHAGLRAGYAGRCCGVGRWRPCGGGRDQFDLVDGLQVGDGRFNDLSERRVGGPFGARERSRSVHTGRGALLWL